MTETKTREAVASAMCRHHWVIDTPNGSVSSGRCRPVGLRRTSVTPPKTEWTTTALAQRIPLPRARAQRIPIHSLSVEAGRETGVFIFALH